MKLTTIGTVIAERTLNLSPHGKVVVRIGKPRKSRGYDDYFCPYEIRWPDKVRLSYSMGGDAVQALKLGMEKIGVDLYTSPVAGNLTWLGMRDLGFPVPENVSDLIPKKKPRRAPKRTALRSSSRKKSSRD